MAESSESVDHLVALLLCLVDVEDGVICDMIALEFKWIQLQAKKISVLVPANTRIVAPCHMHEMLACTSP